MSTRPGLAGQLTLVQESESPPVSGVAAGTVVRVDLGPAEWTLTVQPPGLQMPPSGPAVARPFVGSLPPCLALVRVPRLAGDVGRAVLLHRRGQTLICCLENHISDRAACLVSVLVSQALQTILGDDAHAGTTDPEPRITVTRIDHSLRPADHRHVASADERNAPGALLACSDLVSAELADILGLLCTAYVRILARLTSGLGCGEDTAQSAIPAQRRLEMAAQA